MGYIQGVTRGQDSLFPPSLEELVPEGHWVRVIEAYVARLGLRVLGFSKAQPQKTGRQAYAPTDLLKLYLYGYLQRIRSSRSLEAECQRNVEVMWLLGRLAPDFKIIADFRKDKGTGTAADDGQAPLHRRTPLWQPEAVNLGQRSFSAPPVTGRAYGNGPGGQRL